MRPHPDMLVHLVADKCHSSALAQADWHHYGLRMDSKSPGGVEDWSDRGRAREGLVFGFVLFLFLFVFFGEGGSYAWEKQHAVNSCALVCLRLVNRDVSTIQIRPTELCRCVFLVSHILSIISSSPASMFSDDTRRSEHSTKAALISAVKITATGGWGGPMMFEDVHTNRHTYKDYRFSKGCI